MMLDPFALADPPALDQPSRYRWATVTDTDPLRVRLDGDSAGLPVTPDTLVDPKTLAIGRRVWVQFFGRRLVVLGASPDPAPPVYDTGWLTLDVVTTNFSVYSTGNDPRVRRIGSTVYFNGAVKPTTGAVSSVDGAGNYSTNTITTIPDGFRPLSSAWNDPTFVCQGSGDDRWALRIRCSDGLAFAHRYGPGTPGTSTWLPFFVTWTID
jgi:hypothetical protein